jgi:hypothetical protein
MVVVAAVVRHHCAGSLASPSRRRLAPNTRTLSIAQWLEDCPVFAPMERSSDDRAHELYICGPPWYGRKPP